MQALRADQCRANALHCVDVAQRAYTRDERTEFLEFAECWYRLADEIDIVQPERVFQGLDRPGHFGRHILLQGAGVAFVDQVIVHGHDDERGDQHRKA